MRFTWLSRFANRLERRDAFAFVRFKMLLDEFFLTFVERLVPDPVHQWKQLKALDLRAPVHLGPHGIREHAQEHNLGVVSPNALAELVKEV